MAIIGATGPVGGGGGGGVTIAGWKNEQFEQAVPYLANSLVFALAETPVDAYCFTIDLNGDVLVNGSEYSYDGGTNSITILFGDPYTYDEPNLFQITYPYT